MQEAAEERKHPNGTGGMWGGAAAGSELQQRADPPPHYCRQALLQRTGEQWSHSTAPATTHLFSWRGRGAATKVYG